MESSGLPDRTKGAPLALDVPYFVDATLQWRVRVLHPADCAQPFVSYCRVQHALLGVVMLVTFVSGTCRHCLAEEISPRSESACVLYMCLTDRVTEWELYCTWDDVGLWVSEGFRALRVFIT